MKVIVDTSVWSLALRRNQPLSNPTINQLKELIADSRCLLLGAVRQEILSGLKHSDQFTRLKNHLRAFADVSLDTADYELAAEWFNRCRQKGLQGSNTDFLICASASRRHYPIFTTDQDFSPLCPALAYSIALTPNYEELSWVGRVRRTCRSPRSY